MKTHRISLALLFGAALVVTACSSSSSSDPVDPVDCTGDTGTCCVLCTGGEQQCVVNGLDPADGLDTCVPECREMYPNEQDCGGDAAFVLECTDANQSCATLEVETCGVGQSSALGMLDACLAGE